MKVLELYAGSRSIGKICEKLGHEVFSIDIFQFGKIDLILDCEFLKLEYLPFIPDMIWSSPPCTSYSISAISYHRFENTNPKSEFAEKSDRMNINNIKLINDILKINPNMKFYIENPRSVFRKMDFIKGINRTTVTYCSYGDIRMKPTDIFSNNIYDMFNLKGWNPRPICFNGNTKCHHEASPRSSRSGTQGLKNNHEKSKIPEQLCIEIIQSTQKLF